MTITQSGNAMGFVLSRADGYQSMANVTLVAGHNLPAGSVLGMDTSAVKYGPYTPGATNGLERARAVLAYPSNSIAGDTQVSIIARDAEVEGSGLHWGSADTTAIGIGRSQLQQQQITVR